MSFKLSDDIGDVVRELVEAYDRGELEGIMVFMKKPDETWTNSAGLSFIERLGAVEVIKEDIKASVNSTEEEQ